jgi:hypothetical protein
MMEAKMILRTRWVWTCLFLFGSTPSFAVDDDDFLMDLDEAEEGPSTQRPDDSEDEEEGEDPDEDPNEDPDESIAPPATNETPDPGSFLLPMDEDEEDEFEAEDGLTGSVVLRPGEDNATIYRLKMEEVAEYSADEESLAWEQYLQVYPLSVFRDQVHARLDQLSGSLYGEGGLDAAVDEGVQELEFSQGMLLEPIDPRSKLRAGFAWGFPNWINLAVDYEHQMNRQLSFHGGFLQRFSGPNLEGGTRYAIIKSTRTNFILTAIGDVHLNLDPIAPGLRPMIAVGKRFGEGEAHFDLQAQLGPDLMFYPSHISPRMVAGLNATYAASKTVSMFMESHTYMKDMAWEDGGNFRFNQLSFGIRFKGQRDGRTAYDGAAAAAVPYSVNYWRYHYGAVMGDFNYFL